jgi:hypothetical protein
LLARGDDALCQHERASDADRELAQVIEEETAGGCRQGRVSAVARWGGSGHQGFGTDEWKPTPSSVRKASAFFPVSWTETTARTRSSTSTVAAQGTVWTRSNEASSLRGLKSSLRWRNSKAESQASSAAETENCRQVSLARPGALRRQLPYAHTVKQPVEDRVNLGLDPTDVGLVQNGQLAPDADRRRDEWRERCRGIPLPERAEKIRRLDGCQGREVGLDPRVARLEFRESPGGRRMLRVSRLACPAEDGSKTFYTHESSEVSMYDRPRASERTLARSSALRGLK